MDFLPLPKDVENTERELTREEVEKYVKPGFDATGNPLPDPSISTFVGVIRGGKVVASLCLQVKLHAQPLQIEEGWGSVLPALVKAAEEIIITRCGAQWVYLFCPAGRLSQLAQTMGLQLEPWCVLSKLVAPEIPVKMSIEDGPLVVSREELEQYTAEGGTQ